MDHTASPDGQKSWIVICESVSSAASTSSVILWVSIEEGDTENVVLFAGSHQEGFPGADTERGKPAF